MSIVFFLYITCKKQKPLPKKTLTQKEFSVHIRCKAKVRASKMERMREGRPMGTRKGKGINCYISVIQKAAF